MKKKILALLLACLMIVSIFPMTILADDHEHTCPGQGAKHTLNNCDWEKIETVAPVCGNWGYTRYQCKECNDYFAADFVKPTGDEHVWVTDVEAVAATCTTAGKTEGKHCEKCGTVIASETIPALEHDFVEDHRDGDCLTGGFIYYKCSRCDETKREAIPETGNGHTWGATPDRIEKEPTTTEEGKAIYKCTVCNAEKTVPIRKLPETVHTHTLVKVDAVAATCTTAGNNAYWKCGECGKMFSDAVGTTEITAVPTIDAFGHLYADATKQDYDEIMDRLDAGCATAGYVKSKCSRCGAEKTRDIPAGQHSFDLEGAPTAHKDPTCTEYGYDFYGCTKCTDPNAVYARRIDKRPHSTYEDSTVKSTTPATCTTAGSKNWKCNACGLDQSKTIDALGHDVVTITVEVNCHSKGYEFTYCKRSGCTVEEISTYAASDGLTYVVSVKGGKVSSDADAAKVRLLTFKLTTDDVDLNKHAFTEWEILNDATCTTAGRKFRYCPLCDGTITETETIPAKGHEFSLENGATEVADTKVPATCSATGMVTVKCARCDATEKQTIPKLNHDYGTGTFHPSICGKPAYTVYECANCHDTYTEYGDTIEEPKVGYFDNEEDAKAIHPGLRASTTWTVKREGNCIVVGLYIAVCDECGMNVLIRIDGTGTGHVEGTVSQDYLAPTCTAPGHYKIYECSKCHETVMCDGEGKIVSGTDSTIPATGHTWNKEAASTADCTHPGVAEKWTCTVCSAVDPEHNGEETGALGHDWSEIVLEVPATCTTAGTKAYQKCNRCGAFTTDGGTTTFTDEAGLVLAALGHDVVMTDNRDVNCTLYGYKHYECELCHDLEQEYINDYKTALGHDYSGDPTVTPATCTEDGSKTWNCTHPGCTETKVETIAKLGHKNAAGETLVDDCMDTPTDRACVNDGCGIIVGKSHNNLFYKEVEATCLDYGYTIAVCEKCGYSKVTDVKDDYLADHDFIVDEEIPATITSKGLIRYKCSRPGCDATKTEEIPALTGVQYIIAIDNAVKAGAGLAGGSKVAVTVSLKCGQTDVWGINFDLGYDAALLKFEKAEFVSEKLINGTKAVDNGDKISVVAFAPNSADKQMQNATIEGEEAVVTLYFTILPQNGARTTFTFLNQQTVQIAEDGTSAMVYSEGVNAELVAEELMNVNADMGIDLADAFALYQLITNGEYDVTADLDRDGEITLADFEILYTYITGGITYENILANMAQ